MNNDINVLSLVKGNERYVFLYDELHRKETLETLGRYASLVGMMPQYYLKRFGEIHHLDQSQQILYSKETFPIFFNIFTLSFQLQF